MDLDDITYCPTCKVLYVIKVTCCSALTIPLTHKPTTNDTARCVYCGVPTGRANKLYCSDYHRKVARKLYAADPDAYEHLKPLPDKTGISDRIILGKKLVALNREHKTDAQINLQSNTLTMATKIFTITATIYPTFQRQLASARSDDFNLVDLARRCQWPQPLIDIMKTTEPHHLCHSTPEADAAWEAIRAAIAAATPMDLSLEAILATPMQPIPAFTAPTICIFCDATFDNVAGGAPVCPLCSED